MIEHEHKFLLKPEVADILQGKYEVVYSIDRRYVVVEEGTEFRIWKKGDVYLLTVKFDSSRPEKRTEIDIPVPPIIAAELLAYAKWSLSKRRYECQGWEIDVFIGSSTPFALAEYELQPGETLPDFPEWLKPFVIKEVTDDLRYRNANLARYGIPQEPN